MSRKRFQQNGMIALTHMLEYPEKFCAVALSGPAADVSIEVPWLTRLVGRTMGFWMPRLSLRNDIDASVVCCL